MTRCVGTKNTNAVGDPSNTVDVVVTADSLVEMRFRCGPTMVRHECLAPEALLDLAHQLIAAHMMIEERK